ncbi:MAG: bifunctional 4-hydroxy-2-oxoglutarate aldolase/2-dehydro-3-deoxy-phosphogluconate aldolase [Bifidobacteriaceae bacterium]|jgi:2-dehydro-3-deoxyphosphogluconate aldolase/(4S)-4-hydroxy-2-oxoglutarate aldolase|nr:bifunctional 4-hydroxy-2-oxoglutarate aldolase/2-dehydro-3-deoxy-phosphogluconate aldolase [Bifidobacteriaceae bacterium]
MQLQIIEEKKVIAILRNLPDAQISPVIESLHDSGIDLVEIAFNRFKSAQDNANRIQRAVNLGIPNMHIGAGTVLTVEGVDKAADAGAEFILSPNTVDEVIGESKRLGLISVPAALSPSEIWRAYELGADIVKVFPASSLGPHYFKEILSPLPGIPLSAVGGVDVNNARQFLDAGAFCLGIGSALFPRNKEGVVDAELVRKQAEELLGTVNS